MNAPTIARTLGATALPDSSPAAETSAPARTQGAEQPQTGGGTTLNVLSTMNGGGAGVSAAASGKGKKAAYAAKPQVNGEADTVGTSHQTSSGTAPTQHGLPPSPVGPVTHAGQQPPFVPQQNSAFGKASSLFQEAAPLINGGAGVLGAGMQIAGGVMQAIQSAEMAIAETIKNGAHNVEEASKPA